MTRGVSFPVCSLSLPYGGSFRFTVTWLGLSNLPERFRFSTASMHALRLGVFVVAAAPRRVPRTPEFSERTRGNRVARTSLKHRNQANALDDWEMRVLEQFEGRKAAGKDVKGMEHAEIAKTDGQDRIRFMKAIPTAGVCLACHGESIADDVVAAID